MKEKTLFEKIVAGELPADKVFENEHILAIKDIYPKAPVHLLIFPKKPIKDLDSATEEDLFLIKEVIMVAKKLAREFKIQEGYRLLTNNGKEAGQTIFHLHFHLLGGKTLGEFG